MKEYKKKKPGLKRANFSFAGKPQARQKVYTSKKPHSGFDFLELIKNWKDIVGPNLAKKTIPLKHKGNTLTILTEHSSYSAELKFLEQPLIQKIVSRYENFQGKITRINFQSNTNIFKEKMTILTKQINNKEKRVEEMPLHPQSPEYFELKNRAEKTFGDFEDKELKDSLESLFIQLHAKRKD